ncbi:MAG TPA: glycerate kinase, partial [Nocardioides sp.]|nr:glycerate kinase [Nocardioides sp.]
RGFGQAIAAALDHGVERLLLAIGGSASTDGGAGALSALGARLTRSDGAAVSPGGIGLLELADVDLTGLRPLPPGGATVLCDVDNPLTGPRGAARVFGPQKGASPDDVVLLEQALTHWADLVGADSLQPGAGAAGGTGFGLVAWGASLSSGARQVLEVTDLVTVLAGADAIVTGEGQFDEQSSSGKLVSHVLAAARERGTDAFLVAGRIASPPTGFATSVELVALADGVERAMGRPLYWVAQAGSELARFFEASAS